MLNRIFLFFLTFFQPFTASIQGNFALVFSTTGQIPSLQLSVYPMKRAEFHQWIHVTAPRQFHFFFFFFFVFLFRVEFPVPDIVLTGTLWTNHAWVHVKIFLPIYVILYFFIFSFSQPWESQCKSKSNKYQWICSCFLLLHLFANIFSIGWKPVCCLKIIPWKVLHIAYDIHLLILLLKLE